MEMKILLLLHHLFFVCVSVGKVIANVRVLVMEI